MPLMPSKGLFQLILFTLLLCMCRNENKISSIDHFNSGTAYELSKNIPVPPEKLYAAFLDPKALRKIWGLTSITIDARPEGKAIAKLQIGDQNWDFTLTYKEIVPDKKLQWEVHFDRFPEKEILTTLLFNKVKDGTNIIIRQENFATPQERDENKQAWEDTLIKLDALTNWK